MKSNENDTPPSSVNGDDITGMEDEMIYLGELDEIDLDGDGEEEIQSEEEDMDIEPPEDHAALVFSQHKGSVFCCDLHPSGNLAVTGGEDDKAYVWLTQTGQVVMECTGFKDSVVFVGFSFDGTYLAAADMCGVIKVWKCNTDSANGDPWPVEFEYEAEEITFGLWHFGARVLLFGMTSGDIYVFKIPSGDTKVLQGHSVKVECGKLFQDGVRLGAGYEDGSLKVWDLKSSAGIHQVTGQHASGVIAIDTHPENNLLATISSDGKVLLTTSQNGKVVGQLETDIELETVAFSQDPQLGYLALGTLTGSVNIWDVTRQMVRHHCSKSDDEDAVGVTKLVWVKNYIITACLDGSVRVYEGRSGERTCVMTGHRSEILDFCYNSQQNIVLTTSADNTARIFKCDVNNRTV